MRAVIACLVLPVLAACGGSGSSLPGMSTAAADCFPTPALAGYEVVYYDTVRVRAAPGESYDAELSGPDCLDMNWTHSAAFTGMSSSWVCVGEHVGREPFALRKPSTDRPAQCRVVSVRRVASLRPWG